MHDNIATTLIAVRHGETEWNTCGKQQGHLNSKLTPLGIKQAQAIAEDLVERGIDVLYSSDLGRAVETSKIIAERLSLDIITDARLRERHLGTMQGITRIEFQKLYPDEAKAFNSGDPDYVLPGGESVRQRHNRCLSCIEQLAQNHPGRTICIVAHGGVLMSMFHRALNLPLSEPRNFSLFNAAINTFSINNGRWRLDSWGQIHHLKGMHTLDDN